MAIADHFLEQLAGVSRAAAKPRIDEIIAMVGLEKFADSHARGEAFRMSTAYSEFCRTTSGALGRAMAGLSEEEH